MPETEKSLRFSPTPQAPRILNSDARPARKEIGPASHPASETQPDLGSASERVAQPAASPFLASRCTEKGCVFPAEFAVPGKCIHHYRESTEPHLFRSLQPTLLLLGQAKFGFPESETQVFRLLDRRRLAAEREAFNLEEAA
jgi:hypothetical protein